MPEGPPPTMTTSASICGRSIFASGLRKWIIGLLNAFGLFYFFNQRRHNLKNVSHDAVIRNLENWRFRIFVDGDDRARAFHANDVLDGAADSEREIKLGSNGLPR